MNQEVERKVLELAVERKILSEEDLQRVRTEWEKSGAREAGASSRLVDLFVEKGLLERQAVETLTSEILSSESRRDAGATNREDAGDTSSDSVLDTASALIKPKRLDDVPETFGRYQRLEFLGRGGMAKVYKTYDPSLDRIVALKFVRLESPELTERLMRETRAQAKIDHDNVCKVYEVGQIDGRNYIAMEYIPGKNLREASKDLNTQQKVKILSEVSDALHAAHRAGLMHRDIKPSNIMIVQNEDGDPHPYVMDFGLAREVEAHGLTICGQVLGTPSYMSGTGVRKTGDCGDRRLQPRCYVTKSSQGSCRLKEIAAWKS